VQLAGVVLSAMLWLASCGIPTQESARKVSPGAVPFHLLDPATATTTTVPADSSTISVQVFFARDGRLVPVERQVLGPLTPAPLMAALLGGPRDVEVADGIRSPLQSFGVVRAVEVSGGIAAVDLGTEFSATAPQDQPLALAEIVYTLTAMPGVGRVSFTLVGAVVDVPRGDGSLTNESVSRDDYRQLAPPP
jgi:hypothetical protein